MSIADGYATYKSTYDTRGKVTRETYYGVNGEPVVLRRMVTTGGRQNTTSRATDPRDLSRCGRKTTAVADGYATMKSSYDQRGNMTRETYYGRQRRAGLIQEGWLPRLGGRVR